jgi:hypothetical protein
MHVVFLCLESNKYFFTILIAFVLGLTSQLEIIIVLSFTLPDRHLTSILKQMFKFEENPVLSAFLIAQITYPD